MEFLWSLDVGVWSFQFSRMTTPASNTTTLLEMRNISKRFGPVQALADVSFTVRRGTVHALCGENGAGKSTLMKILAGVHRPDGGVIELHGAPQIFSEPGDALKAGISMIYQELDLAEDLTVAENIFLGAEPKGKLPFTINRAEIVAQAAALASRHGFTVNPTATVATLSTGDCQIVELLKALRRQSSIIVMDEPTSSLSEAEAKRLFQVVRQLRAGGLSIVYISHRLDEVADLADDISVLRDGKVVHSSRAADLTIPQIVQHMVGRELNEFFPAQGRHAIGQVRVQVKNLSSDRRRVRRVSLKFAAAKLLAWPDWLAPGAPKSRARCSACKNATPARYCWMMLPLTLNRPPMPSARASPSSPKTANAPASASNCHASGTSPCPTSP